MLYLVGLGLSDETDITVKGLDVVRSAARVYLEAYTSVLLVDQAALVRPLPAAEPRLSLTCRRRATTAAPSWLPTAKWSSPTATRFCAGLETKTWPFSSSEIPSGMQAPQLRSCAAAHPLRVSATTHTDLVLRAGELSVPVATIPNASILSAIGACGLQLYNFGQTVSMVFFTDTWQPSSFYDRIKENRSIGLHTLVLVDIKVKELSLENLARGRKIYEPPRYMTVGQCATQMLAVEAERGEGVYGPSSLAIGAARVGGRTEKFVAGTLEELCSADEELGPPLHSLVLLGSRTHELERDFAHQFALEKDKWNELWEAQHGKR